jgi:hypothetical protein
MIVKLSKMTPALFVGAAAAAISLAPAAMADPPPLPPCVNDIDGTPCSDIGNIDGGGVDVNIPFGPSLTADQGGASGELSPWGPGGAADLGGASGELSPWGPGGAAESGGASGCILDVGCISIPAP